MTDVLDAIIAVRRQRRDRLYATIQRTRAGLASLRADRDRTQGESQELISFATEHKQQLRTSSLREIGLLTIAQGARLLMLEGEVYARSAELQEHAAGLRSAEVKLGELERLLEDRLVEAEDMHNDD